MAALIVLPLAWVLPAAIGVGLARLTLRRRARAAMQPQARSQRGTAEIERPASLPAPAADHVPAELLITVTVPTTLTTTAWTAVVLARLQRLATLEPTAADALDGAQLLHRAIYATYLDALRLGLGPEAQALMHRRHGPPLHPDRAPDDHCLPDASDASMVPRGERPGQNDPPARRWSAATGRAT